MAHTASGSSFNHAPSWGSALSTIEKDPSSAMSSARSLTVPTMRSE